MSQDLAMTSLIVNRYQVINKIGEGGMGAVYQAVDRLTGDTIAFKQVRLDRRHLGAMSVTSTAKLRLNMAREFHTLAGLRHPNIINVLDYGFDQQKQPYFTMNLLESPRNICDAGVDLSIPGKVNLIIQMLQALAYLHRRGIVHRDLKPGNVLVTQDYQVKVVDFGLAIEREQLEETVGTLAYMSPEVLQENAASSASDLFAVGIITYELFMGKHPFNLHEIMELLKDILRSTPDLSGLPIIQPSDNSALDLQAVIRKLMAPNPQDRYNEAYQVIYDLSHAVNLPVPQESIAIRESFLQTAPFVGRDGELAQLIEALNNAIERRGSAWLIGGESGVGKSRLISELRTQALVKGAIVLHGQSVDGAGLPYKLWREPLRHLLLSAEVSDIDASILKEVVPDIEMLLGRSISFAPETERTIAQQRLIQSIVYVFQQQQRPIMLILEDLQWSKESLNPLRQIATTIERIPLLIVGNYRDDERPNLPEELPGFQVIKLDRLREEHIATISASILGEAGKQQQIVDLLQRETEGNVFFLVEIIRALAEDVGSLTDIGRITLPQQVISGGIRHIIQTRLDKVPEFYRPLLKAAAVIGRRIDGKLLKALYPEVDIDDLITTCANATVFDVLEGYWRFAHDKIREGILENITPIEKAELHLKIAEAIENIYGAAPDRVMALAYHYDRANTPEKALHYIIRSGDQHLNTSLYLEAIPLFQRALSLILPDEHKQVAYLKWSLGSAHWGLGIYDLAETLFTESLKEFRLADDQMGITEALVGLGDVTRRRGAFDDAKIYFEEAMEIAEKLDNKLSLGQAHGRLAVLARNKGDYVLAEHHYRQALRLYEAAANPSRIAGIYSGLGLISSDQGRYSEARKYYEESLIVARKVGNRSGVSLVLTGLAWAQYMEGAYEEAKITTEESLTISQEAGDQWMIANNLGNLGKILFELNKPEQALLHFKEALRIALAIDTPPLLLEILPGVAKILIKKMYYDQAVSLLSLSLDHPSSYSEVTYQAQPLLESLQKRMSPTAFSSAQAFGKSLSLQEAVSLIHSTSKNL